MADTGIQHNLIVKPSYLLVCPTNIVAYKEDQEANNHSGQNQQT